MSTDNFVIRQPTGQRTLALRESYLAICEGDACEAHLLNAQERWYAYKLRMRSEARGRNKAARDGGEAPDANEALWVRMSAPLWAAELLNQYNEKTIRQKLARLVERGFLATRSSPDRKWDRTPQWLFQRATVQAAVDAWESSRPIPDLDPSPVDDSSNADMEHSDAATDCTRTFVRVQSEESPAQIGQMSGSSRTNVRSNNTGVLNRDPLQGSFTGGEFNVTGDARDPQLGMAAQPVTAPVVESNPTPLTTGREGPKDVKAVRECNNEVAVVSPDGEAADAAITDVTEEDVNFLFDQSEGKHETPTPYVLEDVPGGPCGAQEGQEGPSALAYAPHDPEETREVLRRALGGKAKLNSLMEETPPGLPPRVTRQTWITGIAPERAQELANEGRASKTMHPWTAIAQLLDQEIGGQIVRGQRGQSGVVTLPGAYLTPEEKAAQAAALPIVKVGSRWASRKTGKVYIVEDVTSQTVCVQDAGEYPAQKFHKIFQAAD